MSKALRVIVAAGLIFGAALSALGVLANWYPPFDIVNDGVPFLAAGAALAGHAAMAVRADRQRVCLAPFSLARPDARPLSWLRSPARWSPTSPGSNRVVTCRSKPEPLMSLRTVLALCLALLIAAPAFAATGDRPSIEVWRSPTCGCCGKWVKHLEANGFAVTVNSAAPSTLEQIKRQAGITKDLASCHTAKIDGYVIEGHVPASDIKRLVAEHPDAIGLTVPNMPIGSPGMEQPDGTTEPYDVLLMRKDGAVEVFAHH
jgi:hypothetical protein